MTDVLIVVVIAAVSALLASSSALTAGAVVASASSPAIHKEPRNKQHRRHLQQSSPTISATIVPVPTTADTSPTSISNNNWPYHIDLELTFDNYPIDISWKFINIAHPSILLGGVPFGSYTNDEYAGRTIVVPLAILTEDDYHDDDEKEKGAALRQYKFIIYDQVTFKYIIFTACFSKSDYIYYFNLLSLTHSLDCSGRKWSMLC